MELKLLDTRYGSVVQKVESVGVFVTAENNSRKYFASLLAARDSARDYWQWQLDGCKRASSAKTYAEGRLKKLADGDHFTHHALRFHKA